MRQKETITASIRVVPQPKPPPLYDSIMKKHELSLSEAVLVAASIREMHDDSIEAFKSLHPGIREFRMRNAITSLWECSGPGIDGDSSEDNMCSRYSRAAGIADKLAQAKEAYHSLHERFVLEAASKEQKLHALAQPYGLTLTQLAFLDHFDNVQMKGCITEADAPAVKAWLESISPDRMAWSWLDRPSVASLAFLVHKIRFTNDPITGKEEEFLHSIFGNEPILEIAQLMKDQFSVSPPFFLYGESPDARTSVLHGQLSDMRTRAWSSWREPLFEAARVTQEMSVLLSMFDIVHYQPSVEIGHRKGISKGRFDERKNRIDNHDTMTSILISHLGEDMDLDAVFDGVGSVKGGKIAAVIAREALEVAALSGWIRSPEDVRRALVLADLIVKLEKTSHELENMCTTAAVSMVLGNLFWGIHAGDSDWAVLREDSIFSSVPQVVGRFVTSHIGLTPTILINNYTTDHMPVTLRDGDALFTYTDGVGNVVCTHELFQVADFNRTTEEKALTDLFAIVDSRDDRDVRYEPICGCPPRRGKADHRTAFFRFIKLLEESVQSGERDR